MRRRFQPMDKIAQFRNIRNLARNKLVNSIVEDKDWNVDMLKHVLKVFDAETEKLIDEYLERTSK